MKTPYLSHRLRCKPIWMALTFLSSILTPYAVTTYPRNIIYSVQKAHLLGLAYSFSLFNTLSTLRK
jgi:hypothetical protein